MRILVICHEYPPVGGGGGQAARDIAVGLVKNGHQVQAVTSHFDTLARKWEDQGVTVHRVLAGRKEPYRAGFMTMMLFLLSAFLHSLMIILNWRPDIIHIHFAVPAGLLGYILYILTGIPYVLTAHLGDIPGGVPDKTDRWFKWIKPVTYLIWNHAEEIVAVSDYSRSIAQNHYKMEIEVIPNGIDLTRFTMDNLHVHNPVKIVFAGRFTHQKNLLFLVEVLSLLPEKAWVCSLIGDGPLMDEVLNRISSHGLLDRISLPGWITTDEVIDIFQDSDILFMPSLSEGLPVVGVQGLATGLAIVASDAGGWKDLVEDGVNGFIVPNQEQSLYISNLSHLISHPETTHNFRIASRIKAERYDINRIVSAYEDLFQIIISKNRFVR